MEFRRRQSHVARDPAIQRGRTGRPVTEWNNENKFKPTPFQYINLRRAFSSIKRMGTTVPLRAELLSGNNCPATQSNAAAFKSQREQAD